MKRQRHCLPLLLLVPFLLLPAENARAATDAEIIDRIYQRVSEFEKKFPGTHVRRTMTVTETDPDSNEVRRTLVSEQEVWNRVGERPRIEILSCKVDGEVAKAKACQRRERDREPPYRVFGPDGHTHYRYELLPPDPAASPTLYRLKVIPRERTERHFEGILDFHAESLRLMASRGTIADYPMGLKRFSLELLFGELDGYPVPTEAKMDMTLYLPLILDVRVVSQAVAYDQQFLTQ